MDEDGQSAIIGGGRYIIVQPGQAEVAFMVLDHHQGQGVGAKLPHHLTVLAREVGSRELVADVLADNVPMMTVFERSGFSLHKKHSPQSVHVTLSLSV
ncbi:GNAT family N-acetyltransferase [Azospirillum canadense]|uniref:GNAT family N-acetyltransferase n=1 Tax=Azospirillum canadense TaxID=403962 RepID=UPI0038739005|nr:GNAT superfamily N-acetyltransferase [Azospirillum canadense]